METFVVIFVSLTIYLAPTVIALDNRVRNIWTVVLVNVLLGWTLVGWVAALVMAVQMEREHEASAG